MKTIKTKVTPDQIMALEKLMEQLVDFKPTAISNKVVKSVLEDVPIFSVFNEILVYYVSIRNEKNKK